MTFSPRASARTPQLSGRGFTLVELLVSLAIIFVLVGLTFYSLKTIRRSASRTESLNALRQMMGGYTSYSSDHNGALMPGYIDPGDFAAGQPFENMKVRIMGSGHELLPADKASYVWRLAPYLDNAWKTYMADYRSAEIESRFAEEYGVGDDNGVFGPATITGAQLGIAEHPSFGLNSIYVGGDSKHGDQNASPAPWYPNANIPRVAAVRQSEAKSPGKLIVFGATRAANSGALKKPPISASVDLGYPVLWAPFAHFNSDTQTPALPQWQFSGNQIVLTGMGTETETGVPFDRSGVVSTSDYSVANPVVLLHGDHKVPISHLDGSVGFEMLESLGPSNTSPTTKMTRWSPFAVGNN